MSAPIGTWPDAEAVGCDVLDAALTPVRAVTETPPNFAPPLVQVERSGGADDGVTDRPVLTITCYGRTRAEAWLLAERAREALHAAAHTAVNGVLLDSVRTEAPPAQVPDPRRDLRTVPATYQLGLRRHRTT